MIGIVPHLDQGKISIIRKDETCSNKKDNNERTTSIMAMMITMIQALILWACILGSVVKAEVVPVNYTHSGADLQGFLAVPDTLLEPVPAIVIIP